MKVIQIPKISDDAFLCFAQTPDQISFKIKRVYFILKAKTGLERGRHAHLKTQQVLFCIQGSVRMVLDDGYKKEEILLDKPEQGIFLDRMVWHEMQGVTKKTILLVLASDVYKPEDYIRDYNLYIRLIHEKK